MSGNTAKDEESGTPNEDGGNSEGEKKTETFLYGAKGRMIFTILLALAVSLLDALFFYIPVIKNDHRKCISLDKKLETTVISLRSLVDVLYAIYIVARLRHDFTSKYLLRFFPLDLLSAFPLPQVVVLIIVPTMMRGSRFLKAIYLLRSVVLCQYVPRVITTYSFVTSGSFGESAKARAMFTLFIFILAINGIGGLWYFLSTERLVQCWHEACENNAGCLNMFRCNDNNVGNHTFLNDFCPRDARKTDFFNFGIFSDALQSRVVEITDFPKKFVYCLHWSLLSLSCFGQNLETSTYVWENVLAISITISGLLLLLFLLGNLLAYLQAKSRRKEEERRQAQEIENWKPFKMVPKHLKSKVRRYLRYNWLETVGDDMEKFLANLPEGLCHKMKFELYSELMKKVPLFEKMDKPSFESMCGHLSAVFYPGENYVIRKGEAIDRMVFIVHGNLSSVGDGDFNSASLTHGDFCGEELLVWALDSTTSIHPTSSRDVMALEDVQALSLKADDLKFVADRFKWHDRPECQRYLMERRQAEAMERWKPFEMVPEHLKSQVRRHLRYNWLETGGDDMGKFLANLPEDLCERIKVEFYLELLKEVPLFEKLDERSLRAMCGHLSAVFYPKGHYVIKIGEAIDMMLFVVYGTLLSSEKDGFVFVNLTRGGFCFGEELLSWALNSTSSSMLPRSSTNVKAREDVQALILKAGDLKSVAAQYGWHYDEDSQQVRQQNQHKTVITSAQSVHRQEEGH